MPFAHTKYGYAPIYMPDLHGVPLPYTALDKMIESLFGPTAVRLILKKKYHKKNIILS